MLLQRKAFSLQKLCSKDLSWEKICGRTDNRDTKGPRQYESDAFIVPSSLSKACCNTHKFIFASDKILKNTMWVESEAANSQCVNEKCQPYREIGLNKGQRNLEVTIYTMGVRDKSC